MSQRGVSGRPSNLMLLQILRGPEFIPRLMDSFLPNREKQFMASLQSAPRDLRDIGIIVRSHDSRVRLRVVKEACEGTARF